MHRFVKPVLVALTVLPPLFLFLAMQHGALTAPFWDHSVQVLLFEKYQAGELALSDLWASHNHSRPFLFRAIILLNGLLTDWDLRSEYVYVYLAVFGALYFHLRTLRRLRGMSEGGPSGTSGSVRYWVFAAIVSILACSPVGHNNHWWSMMLQLDLTNLFIVGALTSIGLGACSMRSNWIAALFCWAATYTLTNGLVAFATCALVAQLMSPRIFRPNVRTWFWLGNLVLVAACYFSSPLEVASATRPSLLALTAFTLVYFGAPIRGLVDFPFESMFHLPREWGFTCAVGVLVVVAGLAIVWRRRAVLRDRGPETALLLGFCTFAAGSAVLTAWGRAAFDDFGVANANGSRFTVFSSYLIFGLVYFCSNARASGVGDAPSWLLRNRGKLLGAIGVVALLLAGNSYRNSWRVYRDAHRFNHELHLDYALDGRAGAPIFPDQRGADYRHVMQRLRVGPYRHAVPAGIRFIVELAEHEELDEFAINDLRLNPALGLVLFAHPGARHSHRIEEPVDGLSIEYGILDNARAQPTPTDGVTFRVLSRTDGKETELWRDTLDPVAVAADRGLQSARIDTTIAAGSVLVFETTAGASTEADWAYWREITLGPVPAHGSAGTPR